MKNILERSAVNQHPVFVNLMLMIRLEDLGAVTDTEV